MRNKSVSTKNLKTQKQQYLNNFVVVHPLLQSYLQKKLSKCINHGNPVHLYDQNIRPFTSTNSRLMKCSNPLGESSNIRQIQAPFIFGNSKRMSLRPPKPIISFEKLLTSQKKRPQTTSTVIRSRSSQPSIRRKLQFLNNRNIQQNEHEEDNMKPKLKRY